MPSEITPEQVAKYQRDGCLIIPALFKPEEIERLYKVAIEDVSISKHSYNVNDQSGMKTKLALWFTPGNDIYSLSTKSQRIIDAVNKLLDDDAPVLTPLFAHFPLQHSKLKYGSKTIHRRAYCLILCLQSGYLDWPCRLRTPLR